MEAILERLITRQKKYADAIRARITASSVSLSYDELTTQLPPHAADHDSVSPPPPGHPLVTPVRQLPLTPWNPKFTQGIPHATSQRVSGNPSGGGGGNDDDDTDGDDSGSGGRGGRGHGNRNQRPGNFKRRTSNISITRSPLLDQVKENNHRRRIISSSLYYPVTADLTSNKVAWLSNSIDGPYDGKLDPLTKCAFQLPNDSPGAFYIFYGSLKSFLTGCGFNDELLPALQFVDVDLDLTKTPVGPDIPSVGAKDYGDQMPHYYWQEQHDRLSAAIFALLVSKDVINKQAGKSHKTLGYTQFRTSGFKILQHLLLMHHPRLSKTQAPGYGPIKDACPTMPTHTMK